MGERVHVPTRARTATFRLSHFFDLADVAAVLKFREDGIEFSSFAESLIEVSPELTFGKSLGFVATNPSQHVHRLA